MSEIKQYQNWSGLVEYTKEFKEWIWKLFRKVHARIGHVEEELAKVRENSNIKYEIKKTSESGKYVYSLYETVKKQGPLGDRIIIDPSAGVLPIEWVDIDMD